jgi:hypothetical protein
MGSFSGTSASAAMYEDHEQRIAGFVAKLQAASEQCGALFLINGTAIGFDLFENSTIFNQLLTKLVYGYALDAIDQEKTSSSNGDEQTIAQQLLEQAKMAQIEVFKAVGEGQDLRLVAGTQFSGGALEVDGRILHIFGFNNQESSDGENSSKSRISRPSMRRSFRH